MAEEIQLQAGWRDYLGTEVDLLRVLASGWETTVFEFAHASPAPPGRNCHLDVRWCCAFTTAPKQPPKAAVSTP